MDADDLPDVGVYACAFRMRLCPRHAQSRLERGERCELLWPVPNPDAGCFECQDEQRALEAALAATPTMPL